MCYPARMLHRDYVTDEPLSLLMRRCDAIYADKQSDGSYILHAYPNKDGVRYLATSNMLEAAREFLKTNVPPLRGEIDPTPLDKREKPRPYNSGKRMRK